MKITFQEAGLSEKFIFDRLQETRNDVNLEVLFHARSLCGFPCQKLSTCQSLVSKINKQEKYNSKLLVGTEIHYQYQRLNEFKMIWFLFFYIILLLSFTV